MTEGAEARPPLLYASWGGTGRAASVRQAMDQAVTEGRSLHYLAVLDDEHFADLDRPMIGLVIDELEWLLDAQLELTRSQLGADDLPVAVTVRPGRVVDLVTEVAATLGTDEILIGAPFPVAEHDSIQSMIDQISARAGCPARVITPDGS